MQEGSNEEEKTSPLATINTNVEDVIDEFLKQTDQKVESETSSAPSSSQEEASQMVSTESSTISTIHNTEPPVEQKTEESVVEKEEEEITLDRIPIQEEKEEEEEINLDRIQIKEDEDEDEHTTLERIQLNGDDEANELFSTISKQTMADNSLPLTVEELVNQFKTTEQNQPLSYEDFEKLMAQGAGGNDQNIIEQLLGFDEKLLLQNAGEENITSYGDGIYEVKIKAVDSFQKGYLADIYRMVESDFLKSSLDKSKIKIDHIIVIINPFLKQKFMVAEMKLHQLRRGDVEFDTDKIAKKNKKLYLQKLNEYREKSWRRNSNILRAYHGTKHKNIPSIVKYGLQVQTDPNKKTDAGYYGSGIYFSKIPRYAAAYNDEKDKKHCLLLSWILLGRPFPMDTISFGCKCVEGFDSHYVLTRKKKSKTSFGESARDIEILENVGEKEDYFPIESIDEPIDGDEIVIFNSAHVYPQFMVVYSEKEEKEEKFNVDENKRLKSTLGPKTTDTFHTVLRAKQDGEDVFVTPGVYPVFESLVFGNQFSLTGENRYECIIELNDTVYVSNFLRNLTIRKGDRVPNGKRPKLVVREKAFILECNIFDVDVELKKNSEGVCGCLFGQGSVLVLDAPKNTDASFRVTKSTFEGGGVKISGKTSCSISDCIFTSSPHGVSSWIQLLSHTNTCISNCYFHQLETVVECCGNSKLEFSYNRVKFIRKHLLQCKDESTVILQHNEEIEDCVRALHATGRSVISAINNKFKNILEAALVCDGNSSGTFSSNEFYDCNICYLILNQPTNILELGEEAQLNTFIKHNNVFSNISGSCVCIRNTNAKHVEVSDNNFTDFIAGIELFTKASPKIVRNVFHSLKQSAAILCKEESCPIILSNKFVSCFVAVECLDLSAPVIKEENMFHSCANGIIFRDLTTGIVEKNQFVETVNLAIQVVEATQSAEALLLERLLILKQNSFIYKSGFPCNTAIHIAVKMSLMIEENTMEFGTCFAYISNNTIATISKNIIQGSLSGIVLQEHGLCSLVKNSFLNLQKVAISCLKGDQGTNIVDNSFSECLLGISIQNSTPTVEQNSFLNNTIALNVVSLLESQSVTLNNNTVEALLIDQQISSQNKRSSSKMLAKKDNKFFGFVLLHNQGICYLKQNICCGLAKGILLNGDGGVTKIDQIKSKNNLAGIVVSKGAVEGVEVSNSEFRNDQVAVLTTNQGQISSVNLNLFHRCTVAVQCTQESQIHQMTNNFVHASTKIAMVLADASRVNKLEENHFSLNFQTALLSGKSELKCKMNKFKNGALVCKEDSKLECMENSFFHCKFGVYSLDRSNLILEKNTLRNVSTAVLTEGQSNCNINHNSITGGSNGIIASHDTKGMIVHNYIQGCKEIAIALRNQSNFEVNNNQLVCCREGIQISSIQKMKVEHNTIEQCGELGICLHEKTTCQVTKNRVVNSQGYGIVCKKQSKGTVTRNHVRHSHLNPNIAVEFGSRTYIDANNDHDIDPQQCPIFFQSCWTALSGVGFLLAFHIVVPVLIYLNGICVFSVKRSFSYYSESMSVYLRGSAVAASLLLYIIQWIVFLASGLRIAIQWRSRRVLGPILYTVGNVFYILFTFAVQIVCLVGYVYDGFGDSFDFAIIIIGFIGVLFQFASIAVTIVISVCLFPLLCTNKAFVKLKKDEHGRILIPPKEVETV